MIKLYIKSVLILYCFIVFFVVIINFSNVFASQDNISSYELVLINKDQINKDQNLVADKGLLSAVGSIDLVSNLVFINRGQDLAADKGLLSAVSSVGKNSMFGTSYFGSFSLETSKYKVSSGLDVNSFVLISGIAQKVKMLTAGAFFEYSNGNYDNILNNFEGFPAVKCSGDKECVGGGLLCRLDFGKFYLDFSGRKGLLKSKFRSLTNDKPYYGFDLQYFSSHAGLGYMLAFSKQFGIDIFSKCFFAHQDGKENVTSRDDVRNLNFPTKLSSQRLLCGLRVSKQTNTIFSFYGGLSAEYEFFGDVKATENLKGCTETIEFGVLSKSKSCSAELCMQSYLGVREGFRGTFKISFAFFNYLERFAGYSLDKFENEKVGRFNKVFSFSKKECFLKVLGIIKDLNGKVTHKSFKKGYIAAFEFSKNFQDFCLDSTEVCIYIKDLENINVNVEVVSNNSLLADVLSKELFQMLNKDKKEQKGE
jgi:hypothetical protein